MYGFNLRSIPPVTLNLLFLNGLAFLATFIVGEQFVLSKFALYYPASIHFEPYQLVTHFFLHAGLWHILFNMLMLGFCGVMLERIWGGKRLLIFYLAAAFGGALLHIGFQAFELYQAIGSITFEPLTRTTPAFPGSDVVAVAQEMKMLGASGAVYGLLAGVGLLFPNTVVYVYGILPVKIKHLVMFLIAMAVVMGFRNSPGDSIAHFAHLGGALFGFILVKVWQRDGRRFY